MPAPVSNPHPVLPSVRFYSVFEISGDFSFHSAFEGIQDTPRYYLLLPPFAQGAKSLSVSHRIHFAITSHGLGHLTRAIAVANELHRQEPGVQLAFSTTLPEERLRQELPFPFLYRSCAYEPGVAQKNCFQIDPERTREEYRRFFAQRASKLREEKAFLNEVQCTGVVSDASALAIRAANQCKLPNLVLANFTWDWILEPILTNPQDQEILETLRSDYASGMLHLQYPFGPTTSPVPRTAPVPMVSRKAELSAAQVRSQLNLPPRDQDPLQMVLVCPGGWEPDAWAPIHVEQCNQYRLVCVGNLPITSNQPCLHLAHDLPAGIRFTDLVATADIVLTKPGYGMASECVRHQTPILCIERSGFRETGVLLKQLRDLGPVGQLSLEDFFEGRWNNALDHTLAQETPWNAQEPRAAEKVAQSILHYLNSAPAG